MSLIHTLTILICLAALFSYVNHRLLGGVVDREPRPLWVLMQIKLFSLVREFSARTTSILTWGGPPRRDFCGIASVAAAGQMREAVVTITYAVVVFSILVQGLTINRVLGSGESVKNRAEDL